MAAVLRRRDRATGPIDQIDQRNAVFVGQVLAETVISAALALFERASGHCRYVHQMKIRIHTQLGQWPDGSSYFCIARSVRKRGGRYGVSESYYSIGLGCDSRYAADLVYGDGLDLDDPAKAVPVGISCRTCERMDCRQRAFPPMNHRLDIDENSRCLSAYVTAR